METHFHDFPLKYQSFEWEMCRNIAHAGSNLLQQACSMLCKNIACLAVAREHHLVVAMLNPSPAIQPNIESSHWTMHPVESHCDFIRVL